MSKLEFDSKISIGNVITIAILVFSLFGGWFSLVASMNTSAKDITAVTKRVDNIEAGIADIVRQINAEKIDPTRILTQMQIDMRYTRSAVDELRQRQER